MRASDQRAVRKRAAQEKLTDAAFRCERMGALFLRSFEQKCKKKPIASVNTFRNKHQGKQKSNMNPVTQLAKLTLKRTEECTVLG